MVFDQPLCKLDKMAFCSRIQHSTSLGLDITDFQLAMTTTLLLIAPILGIVFYSSIKARPNPAGSFFPNAPLLLIALFTSTLGLALFLPQSTPQAFIVPLVPLTMMSSMRGGKDDMSDGLDWEWTVILHNTITF